MMANTVFAWEGRQPMDYLAFKLVWWLALAVGIGMVVGWLSCGRAGGDSG
jgi:hypothetical protein